MCTKPLKGFVVGETKNGKPRYIITPYSCDHVELTENGSIVKCSNPVISDYAKHFVREFTEIPCGKCLECRLEYSRQWANRCILEAQSHKDNCFITLTYDDLHVPVVEDIHPETGEIVKFKTLIKEDLQKFLKRLRSHLDEEGIKIRYFACGEYGDQSKRPHYHLIIFGWKPDENDLHLLGNNFHNDNYYYSDLLEEVWPYGNNLVAKCTWESCAYVARYVVKKYKSEKDFTFATKIVPEFVTMSRKPGIGMEWISSHDVCYAAFLENYISTEYGSRKISKNRYFDSIIEKKFPEIYQEMKERRKHFQQERKKIDYFESDLPYLDRLHVRGRNLENRTKVFKRSEI